MIPLTNKNKATDNVGGLVFLFHRRDVPATVHILPKSNAPAQAPPLARQDKLLFTSYPVYVIILYNSPQIKRRE